MKLTLLVLFIVLLQFIKLNSMQNSVETLITTINELSKLEEVYKDQMFFEEEYKQFDLIIKGLNLKQAELNSTLFYAIKEKQSSISVQILLTNGANVNARDEFCFTPLHIAADKDLVEIANILLSCGASKNLTVTWLQPFSYKKLKLTPLDIANIKKNQIMINLLSNPHFHKKYQLLA